MNALRTTVFAFAAIAAGIVALPSDASACGGPFGPGSTIAEQKILVSHRGGTQSYVFQPTFCGESESFGLVLPIPAALSANPALASSDLFRELARHTAPTVVKKTECRSRQVDKGGSNGGLDAGVGAVNVIGVGQVGIFDWSLLQATDAAAFTDWLDANNYPHKTEDDALFGHYVTKGWHFVAFKISATASGPTAGKTICGELGPIKLAFPAATPALPARIAAAGATGTVKWDLYSATPGQQLRPPVSASNTVKFSGDVGAGELTDQAIFGGLIQPGDHLARFDLSLVPSQLTDDLTLEVATKQTFRATTTEIEYVDCPNPANPPGPAVPTATPKENPSTPTSTSEPAPQAGSSSSGCSTHGSSGGPLTGLAMALLAGALRLVRRRR